MATEQRPMDPNRLVELREFIAAWRQDPKHARPDLCDPCTLAELLADRDRLAEAERRLWAKHIATVSEAALDSPALFSVRAAMQEAGIPDSEMGKGVSSADAIRFLAKQRDDARVEIRRTCEALTQAHAEVTRLRSRVQVEADDVERAGVTRAHVEAWLLANGWTMESKANTFAGSSWSAPQVKRGGYLRGGFVELPAAEENATDRLLLAGDINTIAKYAERHGLDILDEMAATEVPK